MSFRLPTALSNSRRSFLQSCGAAAIGLTFGTTLASCGKQSQPAASTVGGEEPKLNFYNWDTYIGKTTLADFKQASGIDVTMSLFATNDELFAKLRAGNSGYDVIVPSNEYVTRMADAKMLTLLDHAKIPNAKNLAMEFQDTSFDPVLKYCMPYMWGVIGIGYRKSKVDGVPDSWKDIFDSPKYKGRIALLSESADLCRLAAKYLGHSVVGVTPEVLAQAEAMLIKQKPNIKAFHDDNGQDMLQAGDVDLVMEYNGDIAQVMREDKDLDFVIPKEGSLLNCDSMCIPAGAPHPENAHKFLNFVLDSKNGAEIAGTILYPTTNGAARDMLPDEYKNNPVIFPSKTNCEYGAFEGDDKAKMFEDSMTRIRAA